MHRAHIIVSGMVQGVFFRKFTKENALELGLKGWVKNLPKGEVELTVEGTKENIEKLIENLEIGTSAANVENVAVEWDDFKDEFKKFQILND